MMRHAEVDLHSSRWSLQEDENQMTSDKEVDMALVPAFNNGDHGSNSHRLSLAEMQEGQERRASKGPANSQQETKALIMKGKKLLNMHNINEIMQEIALELEVRSNHHSFLGVGWGENGCGRMPFSRDINASDWSAANEAYLGIAMMMIVAIMMAAIMKVIAAIIRPSLR